MIVHMAPWSRAPSPARSHVGSTSARSAWADLVGHIEGRLAARIPGALFDKVERSARALIPGPDGIEPILEEIREAAMATDGSPAPLSVGVSSLRRGSTAYPAAFDEATAAAEIGGLLRAGPGVSTYEEMGAYKYVLGSGAGQEDRDQQRLERLIAYDLRRGTGLLDTLEGFLDHRGNVARTARMLYIHPNTLRQRLERIEREAAIDLDRDDWVSLAVALKVAKLRMLRRSIEREGGSDG